MKHDAQHEKKKKKKMHQEHVKEHKYSDPISLCSLFVARAKTGVLRNTVPEMKFLLKRALHIYPKRVTEKGTFSMH